MVESFNIKKGGKWQLFTAESGQTTHLHASMYGQSGYSFFFFFSSRRWYALCIENTPCQGGSQFSSFLWWSDLILWVSRVIYRGIAYSYCTFAVWTDFRLVFYRLGENNNGELISAVVFLFHAWMSDLYDAAKSGDLERVTVLVEQGIDKNRVGGPFIETALCVAAKNNHFAVVQYLVEQGADVDKVDRNDNTPLILSSAYGHLDVVRYLLEQGADRDKDNDSGRTPLHCAAMNRQLETAKLLMVYGADLNARDTFGQLPIDLADAEEINQAIRDEPRRRMDEAPGKRATEQDRHPNTATLASAQQEEEEDEERTNMKPRLDEETEADEEGKVAEEDEDSEPSDEEDGN